MKRALSFIKFVGNWFKFLIQKCIGPSKLDKAKINPLKNAPENGYSKKRLIVCLHGLNDSPYQFAAHIANLKKYDTTDTDFYIPGILKKGNAKLTLMVQPILKNIKKWASSGSEKELILIGISNGGRLQRSIEAELFKEDVTVSIKKLKVISVVGANRGSTLVNLAQKLHLTWLMSKNIAKEMPFGSKRNKQTDADIQMAESNTPDIERDYTFIATPHDVLVPNYSSTLMPVSGNYKKRYTIIKNHGHHSIIKASASLVMDLIFQSN